MGSCSRAEAQRPSCSARARSSARPTKCWCDLTWRIHLTHGSRLQPAAILTSAQPTTPSGVHNALASRASGNVISYALKNSR
eukprot:scaffold8982_cov125-Isochrysis_galbana.AAC.11